MRLIAFLFALGACAPADLSFDDENGSGNNNPGNTENPGTNEPGTENESGLEITVYSPDGTMIPGMQFNYCLDRDISDPADCTAWVEPGTTINWSDSITWSTATAGSGVLRFNVSDFLEESDIGEDGALDGEDADHWLCEGQSSPELTAVVEVTRDGEAYDDVVGTVPYSTGCSAWINLDDL